LGTVFLKSSKWGGNKFKAKRKLLTTFLGGKGLFTPGKGLGGAGKTAVGAVGQAAQGDGEKKEGDYDKKEDEETEQSSPTPIANNRLPTVIVQKASPRFRDDPEPLRKGSKGAAIGPAMGSAIGAAIGAAVGTGEGGDSEDSPAADNEIYQYRTKIESDSDSDSDDEEEEEENTCILRYIII
jgi:hypothetical protein